MRIVVTGATGVIGSALITRLQTEGHTPVVLSRNPQQARQTLGEAVEAVAWSDPKAEPAPTEALRGADVVINLLGENIAQRWNNQAKQEIYDSRVLGTRNLVAGLEAVPAAERPKVLVSQSASGYYGPHGTEAVSEDAPAGDDFLAGVVVDWEAEAVKAEALGLRVVLARTGVVLSPQGGALAKMLPPFKAGVGGPVAGGKQYVPWIDLEDEVSALIHLAQDDGCSGAYNLTAPNPATNGELSKALGRVLHRPAFAPVPSFAIKALYGEMGVIVTTGVNLVPMRLTHSGFTFAYPEIEGSLKHTLGKA